MMRELIFASSNVHKTEEISQLLEGICAVKNLNDIGCTTDIPETGVTFEENAFLKSSFVAGNFNCDCFADDSGLEVQSLNNEPGVYSARYSGSRDADANLDLVLEKMENETNRIARFKTVISLIINDQHFLFEGTVDGILAHARSGSSGFGYDPIFVPAGYQQTFAELPPEEKNKISHRGIAIRKMVGFLASYTPVSN